MGQRTHFLTSQMDHIVVAVAAVFFAADLEVDNIEVTSNNIAAGVSFG